MEKIINKGGRPFGSIETPHALLQRELRATIKTVMMMREQLEKQFISLAKAINNIDINSIDKQLEAVERMTNIMVALTKNVETLGKYSIGDANRRKPEPVDDNNHTSIDIKKILGAR